MTLPSLGKHFHIMLVGHSVADKVIKIQVSGVDMQALWYGRICVSYFKMKVYTGNAFLFSQCVR